MPQLLTQHLPLLWGVCICVCVGGGVGRARAYVHVTA